MLSNASQCDHCNTQKGRLTPHPDLNLISCVPKDSAIYICRSCRAPWYHCFKTGWDGLLDMSLPEQDSATK